MNRTAETQNALHGQTQERGALSSYAGFRSLQGLPDTNRYLSITRCGEKEDVSGSAFEDVIPEHRLHFIMQGTGTLQMDGGDIELSQGDIFLIPAGHSVHCASSGEEPWHYAWVAFNGRRAWEYLNLAGFHPTRPVRRAGAGMEQFRQLISSMLDARSLTRANELRRQGDLYALFALLIHSRPEHEERVLRRRQDFAYQAKQIIEEDFSDLTIQGLAERMGRNRSYLSDQFRAEFGCTPQEYLIKCRMDLAAELLRAGSAKIQSISAEVGYADPLSFTKAFTRHFGVSPREYRRKAGGEK